MNNNNRIDAPTDERDSALDTLANRMMINNDDIDFDAILAMQFLLIDRDFAELCARFDICPIHHTDTDTCADDELPCRD